MQKKKIVFQQHRAKQEQKEGEGEKKNVFVTQGHEGQDRPCREVTGNVKVCGQS